uniref:Uncharacterized protein n=1 Tax=Arundo donax TaxID=35708 RepID=A0A0A9G8N3_ARUDO
MSVSAKVQIGVLMILQPDGVVGIIKEETLTWTQAGVRRQDEIYSQQL